MSLFKMFFAARCPKCKAKLRYTGWDLPYPKYICQYCINVEEMNMDMSVMHRDSLQITKEERDAFNFFIKRRREKLKGISPKPKETTAPESNTLYICSNFTTRSSICDRCRCNIWHKENRIVNFKEYRECYEPTIFEIKPIYSL